MAPTKSTACDDARPHGLRGRSPSTIDSPAESLMTQRLTIASTAHAAQPLTEEEEGEIHAFARSLYMTPDFGKCDADLRVWVPSRMKVDIGLLARQAGMSVSDWIRMKLTVQVYGVEEARRVHAQRFEEAIRSRAEVVPLSPRSAA